MAREVVRIKARRRHSAEYKAKVVKQCEQPGGSVLSVARAHGLNASMVGKWCREGSPVPIPAMPSFVPVPLAEGATREIAIEVCRGPVTVRVQWPVAQAAACAGWLRDVLG